MNVISAIMYNSSKHNIIVFGMFPARFILPCWMLVMLSMPRGCRTRGTPHRRLGFATCFCMEFVLHKFVIRRGLVVVIVCKPTKFCAMKSFIFGNFEPSCVFIFGVCDMKSPM